MTDKPCRFIELTPDQRREIAESIARIEGDDMAGKTQNNHVPVEQRYRVPYETPRSSGLQWAGLIAFVLVSVAAQAHTLPDPWSHIVSIGGLVGAAIQAWLMPSPQRR
jgi:hypothetical protein